VASTTRRSLRPCGCRTRIPLTTVMYIMTNELVMIQDDHHLICCSRTAFSSNTRGFALLAAPPFSTQLTLSLSIFPQHRTASQHRNQDINLALIHKQQSTLLEHILPIVFRHRFLLASYRLIQSHLPLRSPAIPPPRIQVAFLYKRLLSPESTWLSQCDGMARML